MADARELQYGIDFDTGEAGNSIDKLNQAIEGMEVLLGSAEAGVQRFGAGAVSACNMGQQGARDFTAGLDLAEDAIVNAGEAAGLGGRQTRRRRVPASLGRGPPGPEIPPRNSMRR